jgi:DNA-binding GntR family transcriptional regulator
MSFPQLKKVERESIATQVYETLKQSIVQGTLPSGTHLIETTIAKQMGTSRGPVREALRQLEADGVVEVRANVGTFVRALSMEEIQELYTVRSVLEGYAASLAAERATPADIERLQESVEAAIRAAQQGDLRKTATVDFDLHRTIWEIARHRILFDLLSLLEVRIRMFISLQAPLFKKLMDSIQDHRLIVKAIGDGDAETAGELVRTHIMEAGLLIVEHMEEQEDTEQSSEG